MVIHKKQTAVFVAVILALLLAGCNNAPDPQGEVEKIIITRAGSADREFTVEQLQEYDAVERDVESVNSSGEVTPYTVKGVLFADVLNDMELIQMELDAIRLVAGDGYSIEVGQDVLANREIILAYEVDGEPLFEDSRPIRIIIPEERAMYWVRNLVKIEILQTEAPVEVSEIYVIETASAALEQQEYLSDSEIQQAVATTDLIAWTDADVPNVHLLSVDGLAKNETWENFSKGLIMLTGADAPAFVGEDLPKGMHVKEILWLAADHKGFVSVANVQKKFSSVTVDGNTGIALSEVLAGMGFIEDTGIILTASDGYAVSIAQEDVSKGIIYLNNEGKACVMFDRLPRNTSIKEILKISVVE
jgi:hypothetical protein